MVAVHGIMLRLARIMALLGGVVLLALIIITCVSIVGRAANTVLHSDLVMRLAPEVAQGLIGAGVGAVRGSFELVEAGMAFAIFAFLPFCQITMGHASVDIFAAAMPRWFRRVLDVAIAALFALVLVVIAMQLNEGLQRKIGSGQTSLLLEFPIWWAYAASLVGAVAAAVVAVWMALLRLYELLTGRVVAPDAVGANH